ncbi:HAMP domain-containing sensor histidine kinase [Aquisalimonas lutea]|uniref:sensor histidine kinase n=1 Tax=Aquisalimonas lutea TaxID=1327750 RepID=UPI0025B3168E|nr:HAMP domain-containing sensor histidine kinase [Aquisalimonas lutea]MDN3517153.1 HAMP domain-containing sensor histidine kinase [Aquisalimonas lutea]
MVSFLGAGLVLGPLVATALLFVSYEILEWNAEQRVAARLDEAVANPGAYSFDTPEAAGGARVLTNAPLDEVPSALYELPDGLHEHETGESGWLAATATTSQGRIIVVSDIGRLETLEAESWVYVLIGTALATAVSLAAGLVIAGRLTAPLERLARDVRRATDEPGRGRFATRLPVDEVRTLAEALDHYRERTVRAIDRERRFSADVSHELRNPLAVIRNAAEIVEADSGLADRSVRALRRIDQAAGRMQETITTLLELVLERDPSGDEAAIVLSDRLDVVIEQEMASSPGQPPRVERREQPDVTVTAPVAVVDVITANLLRNALRHADAQRIVIETGPGYLSVVDDGAGMTAHDEGTAEETDRPMMAGRSGLGLSLVSRLCERFGWTLDLDSAPGRGTRASWRFQTG